MLGLHGISSYEGIINLSYAFVVQVLYREEWYFLFTSCPVQIRVYSRAENSGGSNLSIRRRRWAGRTE